MGVRVAKAYRVANPAGHTPCAGWVAEHKTSKARPNVTMYVCKREGLFFKRQLPKPSTTSQTRGSTPRYRCLPKAHAGGPSHQHDRNTASPASTSCPHQGSVGLKDKALAWGSNSRLSPPPPAHLWKFPGTFSRAGRTQVRKCLRQNRDPSFVSC